MVDTEAWKSGLWCRDGVKMKRCGLWRLHVAGVPGRGVARGVVGVGHWARVWPVEGAWKRCGPGCGWCWTLD